MSRRSHIDEALTKLELLETYRTMSKIKAKIDSQYDLQGDGDSSYFADTWVDPADEALSFIDSLIEDYQE